MVSIQIIPTSSKSLCSNDFDFMCEELGDPVHSSYGILVIDMPQVGIPY